MQQNQSKETDGTVIFSARQQYPGNLFRLFSLIALSAFLCWGAALDENSFLEIDRQLEQQGTALAVLESVLTAAAASVLISNLAAEKRKHVWIAGMLFTLVALAANLADYYGTLQASPDLALEVSPIWNGILRDTGIEFARLFGLLGKITVSLLAGACLTYYLKNVPKLKPRTRQHLGSLIFHLGEDCSTAGEPWLPFTSVFAFYFAAANLFCFYIAYANSLVNNLPALRLLPPLPAAVAIALVLITAVFIIVTHHLIRRLS
jgi:hypothetical protein